MIGAVNMFVDKTGYDVLIVNSTNRLRRINRRDFLILDLKTRFNNPISFKIHVIVLNPLISIHIPPLQLYYTFWQIFV